MSDNSSTIEVISRGLCMRDGHVLLCRSVTGGYLYLPGGHVEIGEPAAAALAREMLEECGSRVEVGSLLLVSEHQFTQGGKARHELNLTFEMVLHGEHLVTSLEPDIAFEWVDLAVVQDLDVRPLAIRAWLASGGANRTGVWLSDFVGPSSATA